MKKNTKKIAALVSEILLLLGEDPRREGLKKTPLRVAQMLESSTAGNSQELKKVINKAIFQEKSTSTIILKQIEFYSTCEHHLMPFLGKCYISYLPQDKIIGISKLARIVDMYSKRFQLQERLTTQIAKTIQEAVNPQGLAVYIEAHHLCLAMRGVQKQNATLATYSLNGKFSSDQKLKQDFFTLINKDSKY